MESDSAQHSQRMSMLYQKFFEYSPYGFFVAEPTPSGNLDFILLNRSATALLNNAVRLSHPDYATGLRSAMDAIASHTAQEQRPLFFEHEDTLLLEGYEQHVKALLTPLYDESGALAQIIGFIDDVSLQKSREHMLALREAEFRLIAEHTKTGIVRFDTACRRIYVNPFVAQSYEHTAGMLIGKKPSEFPGGKAGEIYETHIREVLNSGQYKEYAHEINAGDAVKRCRIMLFPEWLPTGEVRSVLAIGQDMSEQQEKLQALQQGSQEFETFISRSPNVIMCFDSVGRCTYLNETAAHLFRELELLPPFAPGHEAHPLVAETQSAVKNAIEYGEALEKELAWSSSTHRQYHYRIRYVPKFSAQGEIVSVFAIALDILPLVKTDAGRPLDELAAQLAAQKEAARENERRRIALEIHDELGQLLTALRFRLALLRPQIDPGKSFIEKSIHEALDIIDQASREIRHITTNARPIMLNMGLHAALADLVDSFSSHTGIAFRLLLDEDELPLDEVGATVVFRIVQESVTNIVRHSGAQEAEISLARGPSHYHLKIADNGSGFDLSAPRRKSLGLVGIRERVMLLNGELSIQSTPGQGTVIHIAIPIPLSMPVQ
ncbi:MAG TPA: PAS domain-containing protein [Rhodocyclaceae bacterium]|nr:PAS domain-containing protein [Rhodocyclaceae bacterium]